MIPFSKYKEIDSFQAFNLLNELQNPDSKYKPAVYFGAIGTILLVNKWIIVSGQDEFLNEALTKEINDNNKCYYDLYLTLKRMKFKAISPLMVEAIYNNDYLPYFELYNYIKDKSTESDVISLLDSLKGKR